MVILWRLYIQSFYMYWSFSAFPRGYGESQYNAVLSQALFICGFGRPWGRPNTGCAPSRINSPGVGCWPLDAGYGLKIDTLETVPPHVAIGSGGWQKSHPSHKWRASGGDSTMLKVRSPSA